MAKAKKQVFSATKAVKANARERVGTPKPGHALPTTKEKAESRKVKHKATLGDLLRGEE